MVEETVPEVLVLRTSLGGMDQLEVSIQNIYQGDQLPITTEEDILDCGLDGLPITIS